MLLGNLLINAIALNAQCGEIISEKVLLYSSCHLLHENLSSSPNHNNINMKISRAMMKYTLHCFEFIAGVNKKCINVSKKGKSL
jgi:hypothetical protein